MSNLLIGAGVVVGVGIACALICAKAVAHLFFGEDE